MTRSTLEGTSYTSADKLAQLRDKIQSHKFKDEDEVRQFVNRFATVNPEQVRGRFAGQVQELVGSIRSELGLAPSDEAATTKVISDHVRKLISGHAQASEDTAHRGVLHAANRVTMYSGQLVYDAQDLTIDGAGMDFVLRRTYKNQGFYDGPLGVNWDHGYNLWLRVVDARQIVLLTGGFRETTYLKHRTHGYWTPPPGGHGVVIDLWQDLTSFGIASTHGCRWGLRLPNGVVYFYEHDQGNPDTRLHRIRRIEDRLGRALEFHYEQDIARPGGRLARVMVNNQARSVTFSYDARGRIETMMDHSGRTWRYAYDDFGDLVTVTTPSTDRHPQGLTERYVYSTASQTGALQHNLVQVYDTAGRCYLENTFGSDGGRLSFNRVIRQREGSGERTFDYEDVRLAAGLPAGQPEIEQDLPAHQTVMVRRNGHPVHYIFNRFGNLVAREEDCWSGTARRRLVTHYRYNRDGALIGLVSPEGRVTQHLYGRDEFVRRQGVQTLAEDELRHHSALGWRERQGFGNRLATTHRARRFSRPSGFVFPSPLLSLGAPDATDIIVKQTYEPQYQNISSVSDPRYTRSPFPNSAADGTAQNPDYQRTLTRLAYRDAGKLLQRIEYPDTTVPPNQKIRERFLAYDARGRLTEHEDRGGTLTRLSYFNPGNPGAVREGYLESIVVDPVDPGSNPEGLNLETRYEVNDVGMDTRVTTPKGQVSLFDVDALDRVTKVSRSLRPGANYETRYIFASNGRLEQVERDLQDVDGRPLWGGTEVRRLAYDENDNVVREQVGGLDPSRDLITRHVYDDGDLRTSGILPRGNRIHVSYNERRLPRRITRGAGTPEAASVELAYDGDGLVVRRRDGRGLETSFIRDAFGRVVETREHDARGEVLRLVRHDYDKADNLVVERLLAPTGTGSFTLYHHASFHYNELSQLVETRVRRFQAPLPYTRNDIDQTDDFVPVSEAARTSYTYDKSGRLVAIDQRGKRLDGQGQLETHDTVLTTTYEYNAAGWPVAETDPLGNRSELRYDAHGLVVRIDAREKVPVSIAASGEEVFTTVFRYDSLDRLTAITDGLGNRTSFEHDSRDALVRRDDPLGNVTRFEYDVYGRRVAERVEMTDTGLGGGPRQPNSDVVTRFRHDDNGNLARVVDARGIATEQAHDALDRLVEVRYVDGSATTYGYDGNDNVVELRDNNGLLRRMTYDALDNPLRTEVDDSGLAPGLNIEGARYEVFEHDVMGRMTRARNEWADLSFAVDSLGRVHTETTRWLDIGQSTSLRRWHDDFGFVGQLTYPSGRIVGYRPDGLNRVADIENRAYGAAYPGDGTLPAKRLILENIYRGKRLGARRHGNGASTTYAHDGGGRIVEIGLSDGSQSNLLRQQYLYDAAGNLRLKHEYAPGDEHGERYEYDSLQQLTRWQTMPPPAQPFVASAFCPAQDVPPDHASFDGQAKINARLGSLARNPATFTFEYDSVGNRLRERVPGQPVAVEYDVNDLNQYVRRGLTHYRWDLNGNLREEQRGATVRTYVHNHRNQIVRISEGVDRARFRYDALGRRIWSHVGGQETRFVFNGENVIEELSGAGAVPVAQYVNDSRVDGQCQAVAGSSETWLHQDLVGSVRTWTDGSGTNIVAGAPLVQRYTPFGDPLSPASNIKSRYRYAGRPFIDGLGIYDFRHRYYSPELGRFLERDVARKLSKNAYSYVNNRPLTLRDPLGLQEEPANFISFEGQPTGVDLISSMSVDRINLHIVLDPNDPLRGRKISKMSAEEYSDYLASQEMSPGEYSAYFMSRYRKMREQPAHGPDEGAVHDRARALILQYLKSSKEDAWLAWRKSALSRVKGSFHDKAAVRAEHFLLRYAMSYDKIHGLVRETQAIDEKYHTVRKIACEAGLCVNDPFLVNWENKAYEIGERASRFRIQNTREAEREEKAALFMLRTTNDAIRILRSRQKTEGGQMVKILNFEIIRSHQEDKAKARRWIE
jgi:RHS repeat-associated protein